MVPLKPTGDFTYHQGNPSVLYTDLGKHLYYSIHIYTYSPKVYKKEDY